LPGAERNPAAKGVGPGQGQGAAAGFGTPPVPVPIMLFMVTFEEPLTVSPKVEPVIVPVLLKVMLPVPATMLLALPSVTSPLYVAAVDELLISAPLLLIPVPLSVRGMAEPKVNPFKSRTARC